MGSQVIVWLYIYVNLYIYCFSATSPGKFSLVRVHHKQDDLDQANQSRDFNHDAHDNEPFGGEESEDLFDSLGEAESKAIADIINGLKDNIEDSPDNEASKDLATIAEGTSIESSLEHQVTSKDATEDHVDSVKDDTKENSVGSAAAIEDSTIHTKTSEQIKYIWE